VIIEGLHTFFTPQTPDLAGIISEIDEFLCGTGRISSPVDGVMLGLNGDAQYDGFYYDLQKDYFPKHTEFLYFKHLCGEFYTASAFALWLGSVILESGCIPDIVRLTGKNSKPLNSLLIYNHFRNSEHSLILLKNGRI
jgi:hypothetical protein